MKSKPLLFIFLVCSCALHAQPNIFKYFNPNQGRGFDDDYLKVEFEWNMSGKLQALINEGINSLDEEKFEIAIVNLNKAIKLDSTLWMSHYYRGICHFKVRQIDEAEKDFKEAIHFNPTLAEPHVELAKTYAFQSLFNKAENELDKAVKKNPNLADIYYHRGVFELEQANPYRARKLFEKANEINPKLAKAHFMQGMVDFGLKRNYTRAIEFCNNALKADSTFSPGYFWRALLESDDAPQKALKDLDKAVALQPQNELFIMMRGFFHVELNDYDNAFIDFKNALRAVEVNEDKFIGAQTILDQQIDLKASAKYLIANGYGLNQDAFSLLKKSFCLLLSERYNEALVSVNQAEKKEQSATVFFIKAIILERNRYHPEAFEYLDKALARDNDIYDAHRKKCVYYFEVHDWKNAHLELREMFRLQPASPVGHRLRGMVRFAQGYYGPAIGDLTEFIKTDSSDEEVILMRSVSNLSVGRPEESLKDRIFLAKRHPKAWEYHEVLVENYLLLKDTTAALVILKEFAEKDPSVYLPYLKIIEIYVGQKRWTEAQAELTKHEKLLDMIYFTNQQSKIAYLKGMVTLHFRKNPKQAITLFDKALKLNPENHEARYQRAQTYEAIGLRKKALSDYEELAKFDFKDSKERYHALATEK